MLEDIEPYLHLVAVGGGLLVALLLLVWLGRGVRGGDRRQRPELVVSLGSGHALHLVDIAGRRLIVGTGPTGAPRLMLELSEPAAPWAAGPPELDAPPWVADAASRGPEGWHAREP